MAKFLLLETSTKNCSVAIAENRQIIDFIDEAADKYLHSEKLHPFIDDLLKRNNLKPNDLDAIGVSKGPGSYTGLRIGVSAAKGLCYSLNIPLMSMTSLGILARGIQADNKAFIIPMIDARRMEAYTAVYDQDINIVRNIKAEILNPDSFNEYLNSGKVYFTGDAVEKAQKIISHPQAVFTSHVYPQAKDMAESIFEKWKKKDFENIAYFEPFYLKDFIAKKKKNIFDTK